LPFYIRLNRVKGVGNAFFNSKLLIKIKVFNTINSKDSRACFLIALKALISSGLAFIYLKAASFLRLFT
jgi:hypothetical protein